MANIGINVLFFHIFLHCFICVHKEEKHGCKASDSKEVKLLGQYPPIEKMDASLSTLACCE